MNDLIQKLKKLIYECGEIALKRKQDGLQITVKPDKSPVTNADQEIDNYICNILSIIAPQIPIISEEGNTNYINANEYWSIDPIDGTRSYIKGEDSYTVNIALIKDGHAILGFIYQPENKTLHYTDQNGKLIVEKDKKLFLPPIRIDNQLIGTCSPSLSPKTCNKIKEYFDLTELQLISSSKKLCLIADGTIDLYICNSYAMEWDIAAGNALVKAGGGKLITMESTEFIYGNQNYITPHFFALSNKLSNNSNFDYLLNNYVSKVL